MLPPVPLTECHRKKGLDSQPALSNRIICAGDGQYHGGESNRHRVSVQFCGFLSRLMWYSFAVFTENFSCAFMWFFYSCVVLESAKVRTLVSPCPDVFYVPSCPRIKLSRGLKKIIRVLVFLTCPCNILRALMPLWYFTCSYALMPLAPSCFLREKWRIILLQ